MSMTRREALIRAARSASALALSGARTGLAQEQTTTNAIPAGVVTLEDFEAPARQKFDPQTFEIIRGGGADEITMGWNREAFSRIPFRPRVLVDVSKLDTRVTLFGQELAFPILLAPAAVHGALHPLGELETARGTTRAQAVLVIASSPSQPVEEITRLATPPPWYQLYVRPDRGARYLSDCHRQRTRTLGIGARSLISKFSAYLASANCSPGARADRARAPIEIG